MNTTLKLGVARADITPETGVHLFGYSPNIIADAIHDRLSATAFFFEQGDVRSVFVSVTICAINTNLCNKLRDIISNECNLPASNIIICATHTHSAPNTDGTYGWGDIDTDYCDSIFIPAIINACKEATSSTVNVKTGVASGDSFIGINRREITDTNQIALGQCPWGPFNPKMTVLSFKDENDKVIANIIHYGIHGTCAGPNTEISRDFSGIMIDRMESVTGGITAFFNGPEGDVGPRLTNGYTTGFGNIDYAEELGGIAATDAIKIFNTIDHYDDVFLSCCDMEVNLALDKRLPLSEAERLLSENNDSEINIEGQIRNYYRRIIASYKDGYADVPYHTFRQSILRLGHIYFVSFPYELFSEIGMRINEYFKGGTVLSLSNTNGSQGYFPTEPELIRGGYEIKMFQTANLQPYSKNADYNLITETLKNLKEMK